MITEVFSSVSPDVTVFTGAYDGTFTWEDERNDSVSYISSVMNILSAYSSAENGRFIYISSDAVFPADNEHRYSEEDEVSAFEPRSTAFVQAEDICRQFRTDMNKDIIIARIGGYYHLPKTPEEMDDFISEFCVSYLKNGTISIPDDRAIMPLAQSDAIFFLSRIALAPAHRFSVYHISSGNQLTAGELKNMIADAAESSGYVIPSTESMSQKTESVGRVSAGLRRFFERKADRDRVVNADNRSKSIFVHLRYRQAMLNADRFREEFGINRLSEFGKDIENIVAHILKHRKQFLRLNAVRLPLFDVIAKEMVWLFHNLLPFVENILCFFGFFLLNNSLSGSKYFGRIDFYLIYVLLFAILYGQQQAVFSAFLATAGFLFVHLRGSPDSGVLLDFSTYVWIVQLFIFGLTVGYLKDRLSAQKAVALYDYEHMTQQIDDVRDINESNVRVKDALQTQIMLSAEEMARIAECWRLRKNYEICSEWSERLRIVYPESLEAFSTKLKLLYDTNDRERFFVTLEEMKQNGVPLNHEMMEMVRIFM